MKLLSIFQIVTLALLLAACQNTGSPDDSITEQTATATHIHLSEDQIQVAGLELGEPQIIQMAASIQTTGRIEVPPQSLISVYAPVNGIVQTVQHLLPGDYVKKGSPLTRLAHPDLIHLQSEYLQMRARSTFLEKDYERQQNLAATEAAAQKRVEELESEWKANQAALQGMEAELRLLGYPLAQIQAGEIQPTLSIYAPASGYLTKVNINRGKLTQPDDLLFELVDPSHVHLELQVFAKDLGRVRKGQSIRWTVPGSDSIYTGEVYLVAKMIDTETKTAFIHGHFDEKELHLAPGTFVQANILTEQHEVLGLPAEAVIQEGDHSFVFIREADGFRKLRLTITDRNASYVAIPPDAIPTGAQVVLKGAYYLAGMGE